MGEQILGLKVKVQVHLAYKVVFARIFVKSGSRFTSN